MPTSNFEQCQTQALTWSPLCYYCGIGSKGWVYQIQSCSCIAHGYAGLYHQSQLACSQCTCEWQDQTSMFTVLLAHVTKPARVASSTMLQALFLFDGSKFSLLLSSKKVVSLIYCTMHSMSTVWVGMAPVRGFPGLTRKFGPPNIRYTHVRG
jgi:predicted ATPase